MSPPNRTSRSKLVTYDDPDADPSLAPHHKRLRTASRSQSNTPNQFPELKRRRNEGSDFYPGHASAPQTGSPYVNAGAAVAERRPSTDLQQWLAQPAALGGSTPLPVTARQVEEFRSYHGSLIASRVRTRIASRTSPAGFSRTFSANDLSYLNGRLEEVQTEEDRRVLYTVPLSARYSPVRSQEGAYAILDDLTRRFDERELDEIQYEGQANTLLQNLNALAR